MPSGLRSLARVGNRLCEVVDVVGEEVERHIGDNLCYFRIAVTRGADGFQGTI